MAISPSILLTDTVHRLREEARPEAQGRGQVLEALGRGQVLGDGGCTQLRPSGIYEK